MLEYIATFFGGFILETTSVFWVHCSERNMRRQLTLISAIQAVALVVGVGQSIHDWHRGITFVIGYALGANIANRLKEHLNKG